MQQRFAAEFFLMTDTVFSKAVLCFALLWSLNCGCVFLSGEKESLETLQRAVRQRMLKIQTTEMLTKAAQERYNPRMAGKIIALETGYSASGGVGEDAALDALENALRYALVVLAENPETAAEKLTAEQLDYGTAVRFVKLKYDKGKFSSEDITTELAFMSDWSAEKVRKFTALPLPEMESELFPLYPEAEKMLDERGGASAFRAAAELYRNPTRSAAMKAERLRRAMLNRFLMQGKSPGGGFSVELYTAALRKKLFPSFFPEL